LEATDISFGTLKLRECGRAGGTNKHRFNHYEFRLQRFQEAMTWWLGIVSSTADVTCSSSKPNMLWPADLSL
jgi:hypothetical protein